jgi:hypothetical protein
VSGIICTDPSSTKNPKRSEKRRRARARRLSTCSRGNSRRDRVISLIWLIQRGKAGMGVLEHVAAHLRKMLLFCHDFLLTINIIIDSKQR